jgi:hydroxymethylpyrimidine/phosphomethylpyrimidine kinase
MRRRERQPVALSVAGSDSGGGAGLQADLKSFAALGVHGASVVTCLTAQNPREVRAVRPCAPAFVRAQLEAVFAELPIGAAKTGMLCTRGIVREVARWFREGRQPPLVVDPVMVATSGARLLEPGAVRALQDELLPLAILATPNLDEAGLLTSLDIRDEEGLRAAARALWRRHGCAVLVKGGHLRGSRAADVFYDGRTELLLEAPRVRGVATHGTGCTYSAAVAAALACGLSLPDAVVRAKRHVTQAIAHSRRAGRHDVLDPLWRMRAGKGTRVSKGTEGIWG